MATQPAQIRVTFDILTVGIINGETAMYGYRELDIDSLDNDAESGLSGEGDQKLSALLARSIPGFDDESLEIEQILVVPEQDGE